jgi:hypothetical protein
MSNQGFALAFALLILLLLTLFGLSFLLIAGSYHSSTKNLFENENARLACEQTCRMMIDRHNLETSDPRFFFDPHFWIQRKLVPLSWNGYEVNAEFNETWKPADSNQLKVLVKRSKFESLQQVDVRQIRAEDFALYSEAPIDLQQGSLFHGRVLVRNGLHASQPVRFRDLVQGDVVPETNASFRIRSEQVLNYPRMNEYLIRDDFYAEAVNSGLLILGGDPMFWNGSRYELDLNHLEILKEGADRWRIRYNGVEVGIVGSLHFWFDSQLAIRQGYAPLPDFPGSKINEPLYLSSAEDVYLLSSIQPVEFSTTRHPVCVMASDTIYVSSTSAAIRIHALLIAFGSDVSAGSESGLIIQAGSISMTESEKQSFIDEVRGSVFMVEPEKREVLLDAIAGDTKILWFRGSVFLQFGISSDPELTNLHFESTSERFLFLPSFPFVQLVEGSSIWQ